MMRIGHILTCSCSFEMHNNLASAHLQARDPQMVHSHIATVSSLQPATAYNCSVTSYSYSTPSEPTYIGVSTTGGSDAEPVLRVGLLSACWVTYVELSSTLFLSECPVLIDIHPYKCARPAE